jgi:hypothetical protein
MRFLKIFASFLLFSILNFGCNSANKQCDSVIFKNGLYYNKTANSLASGEICYRDGKGRLQSIVNFKDGIPSGKWSSFGFAGEVIQEGVTESFDVSSSDSLKAIGGDNVLRISFSKIKEGTETLNELSIVCASEEFIKDSLKSTRYLDYVLAYILPSRFSVSKKDLWEISFDSGELEESKRVIRMNRN